MADLHIISSGGVEVGGRSLIYAKSVPTSIVGSGGVLVGGISVVGFLVPGDVHIVGDGGAEAGGQSVIDFLLPLIQSVISDGGVLAGGRSVISFSSPSLHVVTGGVQVGGQSIVRSLPPVPPLTLSVIPSGGVEVGGTNVINFILPPVLHIIGSGGVVVGEFRVPELSVVRFLYPADLTLASIVGSGGAEAGGDSVITRTMPPIYTVPPPQVVASADVFVGGASIIAFISPQILQVIADGGVMVGGEPIDNDIFETWVLTGVRGEPSAYAPFPFNSYAKFREQYFGAGADGIYLLEGSDDDGEAVHSGLRIGPNNYGTDREKRLRLIRCGGKTEGAKVRVSNGNGSNGYYDVEEGRAEISIEVQGREITIDITDFVTLDHLEIVPLVLLKR